MTFQHYLDSANRFYVSFGGADGYQRYGQALMNFLHIVCPKASEDITGTDVDPFYKDELVPEFFNYLSDHWDEYFTN